ncbi:MAG: 50S ribosomal protein L4 [Candidatus Omnitrophota bacterium]|nr:50S ribosomal protein L4 [Candidatus Omnitrophota bacterium]MDZ4242923.1 50S ribosomal protein L4 [Candidatus Omnitrophota bacterium]
MSSLPILDKQGKKTEALDLPKEIFEAPLNTKVLHQAVVMYQASQRQGTLNTKERAYVSGGGKKPFRQKGTGRARAGSIRSPLWHGGGTVFGPHPRDFGYDIPKRARKTALRESLNAKFKSNDLFCLIELKEKISKTKDFAKILDALKLKGKILAILDGCDDSVRLASRNIDRFQLMRSEDVNAYHILRNKRLLVTKTAFHKLLKRIEG